MVTSKPEMMGPLWEVEKHEVAQQTWLSPDQVMLGLRQQLQQHCRHAGAGAATSCSSLDLHCLTPIPAYRGLKWDPCSLSSPALGHDTPCPLPHCRPTLRSCCGGSSRNMGCAASSWRRGTTGTLGGVKCSSFWRRSTRSLIESISTSASRPAGQATQRMGPASKTPAWVGGPSPCLQQCRNAARTHTGAGSRGGGGRGGMDGAQGHRAQCVS